MGLSPKCLYLDHLTIPRHILFSFALLCFPVGSALFAQSPAARLDANQRRLLLQTAGAFENVITETRIDMDSGFLIASRAFALGRCPLIAEGLDPFYVAQYGSWIDRNDLRAAKKSLTTAS